MTGVELVLLAGIGAAVVKAVSPSRRTADPEPSEIAPSGDADGAGETAPTDIRPVDVDGAGNVIPGSAPFYGAVAVHTQPPTTEAEAAFQANVEALKQTDPRAAMAANLPVADS